MNSPSVVALFAFLILCLSVTIVVTQEATCHASGDPHFITFDKFKFTTNGVLCDYVFVKDCSKDNKFTVMTRNKKCGRRVSCLSNVTIRFGQYEIGLSHNKVTVNQTKITQFPYKQSASLTIKKLDHPGNFLIVTDIGLTINSFLTKHKLHATVSEKYKNKTCGLCGNYNGNRSDDHFVEKNECLPPCESSPCKNGGTCHERQNHTFVCTCLENYQGKTCEVRKCSGAKLDIVYLADTSGSITEKNFTKLKEFMKNLNGRFKISTGMVHVGVINYSTKVLVVYGLQQRETLKEVNNAIDGMERFNGVTLTGNALKVCRENVFNVTNGDRLDVKNVAILVSDGNATSPTQKKKQLEEATALKDDGVTIVTIAIGNEIVIEAVEEMASTSKLTGKKLTYHVGFPYLDTIANDLIKETCAI